MKFWISLLIVLSFAVSQGMPALAQSRNDGVIKGQLVNQTPGGASVAGQDVTLKTYLKEQEVRTSAPVKTDAEGKFEFKGLTIAPEYSYLISVVFQGAEYQSDYISLTNNEASKSVMLTVWDATTNEAVLKIATAHSIIYLEGENRLTVSEFLLVTNESDKTYIGSQPFQGKTKTLQFFVPKNAQNPHYVSGLMDCCAFLTEDGLIDTMPVTPGEREIIFHYQVDYKAASYAFAATFYYPTASYDLLVQNGQIGDASSQLTRQEPIAIKDVPFAHLNGKDIRPGTSLAAELTGLPKGNTSSTTLWLSLVLIMVVAGSAVVYFMTRSRRKTQPAYLTDGRTERGGIEAKKQRLLLEIARLDDDYEAGAISEVQYRKLRDTRKAQLAALMRGTHLGE